MTKEEQYQSVLPQIKSLISGETDVIANMANMVAVLHETFGFWWTGFYRVVPNTNAPAQMGELVLGPSKALSRVRVFLIIKVSAERLGRSNQPSLCRMCICSRGTLLVRASRKARSLCLSSRTDRSLRFSTSIVPNSTRSMK